MNLERAIVPCAGLGTRMAEVRDGGPKETVLVRGRPMVRYAVEEALRGGIDLVVLVIRPGKEEVADYFGAAVVRRELGLGGARRVVAVRQERPTGLADAIALGAPPPGEAAALFLPDNVYDGSSIDEIAPAFRETGRTTVGLVGVPRDEWNEFGNCGGVGTEPAGPWLRIRSIAPKGKGVFRGAPGAGSALRWYGRVILTPRFFTILEETEFPRGVERDDVPVFQRLVADEGVTGVPLRGRGFDVGGAAGLARAEAWLAGRGGREEGR